jgi:hypothetical protein
MDLAHEGPAGVDTKGLGKAKPRRSISSSVSISG